MWLGPSFHPKMGYLHATIKKHHGIDPTSPTFFRIGHKFLQQGDAIPDLLLTLGLMHSRQLSNSLLHTGSTVSPQNLPTTACVDAFPISLACKGQCCLSAAFMISMGSDVGLVWGLTVPWVSQRNIIVMYVFDMFLYIRSWCKRGWYYDFSHIFIMNGLKV